MSDAPEAPRLSSDERQYRLLVENAPFCIHQIGLDGRILSMNAAGLRMMGDEDGCTVIGSLYLDAVAPSDRERVGALMAAAFEGTASEFEFPAANGNVFSSNFVPIRGDDRAVTHLMGITQDITEQRRSEEALRESRRRLDFALRGAELGAWDWRLETDSFVVDRRWRAMFGLEQDDAPVKRKILQQLVHPDDLPSIRASVADHVRGETASYEHEHRMRHADGHWVRTLDRGMVVERAPDGQPLRVSGTSLDVTEPRRAQAERADLEQQLQQAQKMESIGQLAGGIAHDFNNLLLVILGHLDLVDGVSQAGGDPSEDLAQVRRAAERAAELTRRLLAFARRQDMTLAPVELPALIDSLSTMVERILPETIALNVVHEPGAPNVEADANQIEQIVLNLCVNARDAMPNGGRIELATRGCDAPVDAEDPDRRWAELTVRDDGKGMDAGTQARAFEPFFTTKGPDEGTGLGLATVYGIARQHGGRVTLDSAPGQGTAVNLRFPGTDRAPAGVSARPQPVATPTPGRVLLVEDEPMVRRLVSRVLTRAGLQVDCANDGIDGVERFAEQPDAFDLVVMDAVMPRLGGRDAFDRLRALREDVPVLFTSGYSHEDLLGDVVQRSPRVDFLSKPYDTSTLLAKVKGLLEPG